MERRPGLKKFKKATPLRLGRGVVSRARRGIFSLCLFLLVGCGYHAGLPDAAMAPSVALRPFDNRTHTPLLDIRMAALFREVLSARGLRVDSDTGSAQSTLSGVILREESVPVSFTSDGQASAHRLTIGISCTLHRPDVPPQTRQMEAAATYQAVDGAAEALAARARAEREVAHRLATQTGQWLAEQYRVVP